MMMHQDQLVPEECFIHALPFDIVHDIFHFFNNGGSKTDMSIVVSHVCQRWRQYALNIPTMWNTLEFSADGLKKGWAKQEVFMQRSKDAALDIKIWSGQRSDLLSISAVSRTLRMLLPHIHRWRSLKICVHIKVMRVIGDRLRHVSAPGLETLSLNVWNDNRQPTKWRCRMFNGGPPNLRKWDTHIQLLPPPSIVCEMDKLRDLEVHCKPWYNLGLRYPKPQDVLQVLSRCPNLERLFIRLGDRQHLFLPARRTSDPITFPNLVSFHISSHWGWDLATSSAIWRSICAPLVRSIVWHHLIGSFISATGSFAPGPFPGLQRLEFVNTSWPGIEQMLEPSMLRTSFSNLSLLSKLIFYKHSLTSTVFEVLHGHCPRLIHLALDSCCFAMSDCVKLVKARLASQSVSSLQLLRITRNDAGPIQQEYIWFQEAVPVFMYGYHSEYDPTLV